MHHDSIGWFDDYSSSINECSPRCIYITGVDTDDWFGIALSQGNIITSKDIIGKDISREYRPSCSFRFEIAIPLWIGTPRDLSSHPVSYVYRQNIFLGNASNEWFIFIAEQSVGYQRSMLRDVVTFSLKRSKLERNFAIVDRNPSTLLFVSLRALCRSRFLSKRPETREVAETLGEIANYTAWSF